MKSLSKKGIQLNQAFAAVLVVVLIGVLIIIGIFLFATLQDTFVNQESVTVTSESIGVLNTSTKIFVANSSVCNFAGFSVTSVFNATVGADVIPASNYTVTSDGGIIYVNGDFNNTAVNATYSFNWGKEQCQATASMITQFGTYPTLVGLVGTIVFLGLVIGVLVASFVFGGRRGV